MYKFIALLILAALHLEAGVGVRLILGIGDPAATRWDGSVTAERASVAGIEGWRFDAQDSADASSWKIAVRPPRLFGGAQRQTPPPVPNGVMIWLDPAAADAVLAVKTQQGDFSIRLADIPFGKTVRALNGRVLADRVPMPAQLTSSPEEQDYPAAAVDRNGDVWLAWIEFRHHPDHNRMRANFTERPKNFDDLKAAPGGDQVFLRKYAQGKWGDPVAITDPGGDLYRPAVAVDGSGRGWVFWSANRGGNFDLWARAVENGRAQPPVRISDSPGSDVFPAAAADAAGRVWVVWQGWRDGKAAIFAAVQDGARFSAPVAVSNSTANEWNPAIAADSTGRLSVAWDSYRNGSYDVYLRTAGAPGKWGPEIPVAASVRYEAYPSLAYDKSGKLWLAYEEGAEGWGKDFGAYATAGVAVYQGRAVRLLAIEGGGAVREASARPGALMPGLQSHKMDAPGSQDELTEWLVPDREAARNRRPSGNPPPLRGPRNSMPRLAVDPSGRVWLAFRSSWPIWWNPIGTVWAEYVVSCADDGCTGPVFLSHTDNVLDNRPALVAPRAGELLVVGASDGRRQLAAAYRPRAAAQRANAATVTDPYQNDLWMNAITLPPARSGVATRATAVPKPAAAIVDAREQKDVAALRAHRIVSRDVQLRIVRGEFHRHSETSMDGGSDGTLIDQWRYLIDAAHMDWAGCCDHDNGGGREYSWWTTQKLTDIFYTPGTFSPLFSYERSVAYPEGHRNVVMARRGVRPLPRLPKVTEDTPGKAPDTLMFYDYLRQYDGIVASHTSGTNMGTDWRDNDPALEPVVEVYQGDRQNYEMPGAPRTNTEDDSIGGWRPKGFVSLALEMGYKLGFQASSDHVSTHMSYCNIYAKNLTRESLMEAFKQRHVYGATDNILADVRSGAYMMGDIFSSATPPEFKVKLSGTAPFSKVHVVKDNQYVYSVSPGKVQVEFSWRDNAPVAGKQSYSYVRGEQQDGELVWASPMWITYTGK